MSAMPSRPVLKELKCPDCGSPIPQFNPSAQTLVCGTCGSYVAVGAGDPELIGKSRKLPKSPVPIEFGKEITVEGNKYMVLGRVMYQGWDEEDRWTWNEWMVGAEDGRMLWLSYDEKGFSIYTKMRFRQPFNIETDRVLTYKDQKIPIRERYPAKIIGAEGELTWRAQENERVFMAEGDRGGKRYSIQKSDEEISVYEGRGVSEREIASAFNDAAWMERIETIERRQGNRKLIGSMCIIFAFLGFAAAIMLGALGDPTVSNQTVTLMQDGTSISIPYNTAGRPSRVRMELRGTMPANTFVDVDVTMFTPAEQESYLFSQSFYHETGVDSDGRWTERAYSGSNTFVPSQAGDHQLRIAVVDTNLTTAATANVSVIRNAMAVRWFVIYAVIVGIVGIGYYMSVPTNTKI